MTAQVQKAKVWVVHPGEGGSALYFCVFYGRSKFDTGWSAMQAAERCRRATGQSHRLLEVRDLGPAPIPNDARSQEGGKTK